MQHPDEGMIHTWLDGQLSAEEAAELEAHTADCAECKAAIAEARGFIAASSRIVSALDAVPAGVIPIAKPKARSWYMGSQFRAAAAVLVVAGASFLVLKNNNQKRVLNSAEKAEVTTRALMDSAPMAAAAAGTAPAERPMAALATPVTPPAPQQLQKERALDQAANSAVENAKRQRASRVATADAITTGGVSAKVPVPASEADFSGKGVKGGTARGVEGPVLQRTAKSTAAVASPSQTFSVAEAMPTVVRTDSTSQMKRTTYKTVSGSEVILTQQDLAPFLSQVQVTGRGETDARRDLARPATPPVAAAAPAPAPVAQSAVEYHTISWMDPRTNKRYTLSGPLSTVELEALKSKLFPPKQ